MKWQWKWRWKCDFSERNLEGHPYIILHKRSESCRCLLLDLSIHKVAFCEWGTADFRNRSFGIRRNLHGWTEDYSHLWDIFEFELLKWPELSFFGTFFLRYVDLSINTSVYWLPANTMWPFLVFDGKRAKKTYKEKVRIIENKAMFCHWKLM